MRLRLKKRQNHDEYTIGQFKDDQIQNHKHYSAQGGSQYSGWNNYQYESNYALGPNNLVGDVYDCRYGNTTHGKQMGINYIIRVQ